MHIVDFNIKLNLNTFRYIIIAIDRFKNVRNLFKYIKTFDLIQTGLG